MCQKLDYPIRSIGVSKKVFKPRWLTIQSFLEPNVLFLTDILFTYPWTVPFIAKWNIKDPGPRIHRYNFNHNVKWARQGHWQIFSVIFTLTNRRVTFKKEVNLNGISCCWLSWKIRILVCVHMNFQYYLGLWKRRHLVFWETLKVQLM